MIDPKIKEYIESEILPRYLAFDRAHNIDHAQMVIEQSMQLSKHYKLDGDMVYIIAAFHDLGLCKGRELHHRVSGEIIEDKKKLKGLFASERLSQVRDIFVFSCFSGLAYIDLANLTKANIKTSFDGNLWIMTKRQKTNTTVNVPLMKIPRIILAKYEGKLKDDMLLPMISNQKLNCYLKEIADICGIDKNLTFHVSRQTKTCNQLKTSVLQFENCA